MSSLSDISDRMNALKAESVSVDALANKSDEYVRKIEQLRTLVTSGSRVKTIISALNHASSAYGALTGLWNELLGLLDPATYVHFYSRSQITNTQHGGASSQADIGGNFSINNFENKAITAIAQGATLQAAGAAELSAQAKTLVVSLSGSGGKYGTAAESGKAGIGATVIVQNIVGDSLVVMGNNTSITGSSVSLEATNVTRQYAVVYGAGDADKFGLNGMINIMNGDSNAVVSVSDSARLTGLGEGGVALNASNDTIVLGITGGLSLGSDSTYAAIGFGLTDINFDTNSIAAISDNATEHEGGMSLLTQDEQNEITTEAQAYGEERKEKIASQVAADITAGYISASDRQGEIDRRLANVKSARRDELLVAKLAEKSDASPEFAVRMRKILPAKLVREIATTVSRPTFEFGEGSSVTVKKGESSLIVSNLSDSSVPKQDGLIKASSLTVTSKSDGAINAIAIEGSYVGQHAAFDKFNGFMKRSKASSFMDWLPKAADAPLDMANKSLGRKITEKIKGPAAQGAPAQGAAAAPINMANQHGDAAVAVNIAGSGSLALVFSDGQTLSLVDSTTVELSDDAPAATVSARDDLFSGSWAGTAAINWHAGAAGGAVAARSFQFGASLGLTSLDRNVDSIVASSKITGVSELKNLAEKAGAQVGAGLGLAIGHGSGGGLEGSAAASVSSNYVNESVNALLYEDTVTGDENTAITNRAFAGDVQVAGGLNFTWSSGGAVGGTFGGSVTLSRARNSLLSGIQGGSYDKVDSIDVQAVKGTTQVNAAVSGAVSTEAASAGFGGAFAYGQVKNTSRSLIADATITAAGAVSAHTDDTASESAYKKYLEDRGIDFTGASYIGEKGRELIGAEKGGSKTLNFAIAFNYARLGGVDAGISLNFLEDTMLSEISGSAITAARLQSQADSKTLALGIALGVTTGARVFGGAGSFAYNSAENTNRALLADNSVTLTGNNASDRLVESIANNDASLIAITGEAGFGRGAAAGLGFAFNDLDNTTEALIQGGSLETEDDTKSLSVHVDADNTSNIAAVAFGVNVSTQSAAVSGTLALNLGNNSTEAAVEQYSDENTLSGTTISDLGALTVTAHDRSVRQTGAGELSWANSGLAAAGVAIAYSEIGGTSVGSKKEKLKARVTGATITTHDGASLTISARDESTLRTAGVGLGISAGGGAILNAQGASAAGVISKTTSASLTSTSIDKEDNPGNLSGSGTSLVTLISASDNYIGTGGAAASGSFGAGLATVGAGLSINKIGADTNTSVADSDLHVAGLLAKAEAANDIVGVGIGASGSLGPASVTGSFNYNYIGSDTTSSIENSTVAARDNIGIIASSDDRIASYAGTLALSNQGGAVGASVSYSEITGKTRAGASQSTFSATGAAAGAIETRSNIADSHIVHTQASGSTFSPNALVNARALGESVRHDTGVVVDSSATHSVSSVVASAGVGYLGAAAAVFAENYFSGETEAYLAGTGVNADSVKTVGADGAVPDVGASQSAAVRASDYTNAAAMVVGAGGGQFLGLSATQNTNNSDRKITARIEGADQNAPVKLNVQDLDVEAVSKQGMSNLGIAAAGTYMGFSADGNFLNNTIHNTTSALVKNADIGFAGKAAVDARNLSLASIGTYNVAGTIFGGAAGISYGAVDQASSVLASVIGSTISDHGQAAGSSLAVTSSNYGESTSVLVSVAGAGIGGSVSVTLTYFDFDAEVGTIAENSTLEANSLTLRAENDIFSTINGTSVGGSALGSSGANSAAVTVSDRVYSSVAASTVTARKTLAVEAESRRDLRQTVANIAGGAIAGIGVNLQENWINKGITDKASQDQHEASDMKERLAEMLSSVKDNTGLFRGLSDEQRASMHKKSLIRVWDGTMSEKTGVHAIVKDSSLSVDKTAEGNAAPTLTISAVERNKIDNTAGSGGLGIVAVVTTLTKNAIHHKSDVQVLNSSLTGHTLALSTVLGDNKKHVDGYDAAMAAGKSEEEFDAGRGLVTLSAVGSVGGLTVIPAFATIDEEGTAGIQFNNTSVSAVNTTLSAVDTTTRKATAAAGTISAIPVNILKAKVNDASSLAIDFQYSTEKTIESTGLFAATAEKRDSSLAKTYGFTLSGIGYNGSLPTATDSSTAAVRMQGNSLTLKARDANFHAFNAPELLTETDLHGLEILGGFHAESNAIATSRALVRIDSGNTFGVNTLAFRSRIGESGRTMVKGDLDSVSVQGLNFAPDLSNTRTETVSSVVLGAQDYLENANGQGQTHLTVSADSYAEHFSHAYMFEVGVLSFSPNGALRSRSTVNDTVTADVWGGTLAEADITADAHAATDTRVSANGFSAVELGVSSKGITDINNTVSATLRGTWDVDGTLNVRAKTSDKLESLTRTTKVDLLGVSWVESEITTKGTTTASVSDDTVVRAGRVTMLAENAFSLNESGKYDKVLRGIVAGFAGGGINLSEDTIDATAKVNIGKRSSVITTGQQVYESSTLSNMIHNIDGTTVELLGGATSRADVIHKYSNIVNVAEGSRLMNIGSYEEGGITLSAHESLYEQVDSSVDIWTVIGIAPNSRAANRTTRNDQITVAGEIDSKRDLNLFAGADPFGNLANTTSKTIAETYNHSVIPIGWSTNPQTELNSNNFVVIGPNGSGKAIRNINIVADAGIEKGETRSESFAWFNGGSETRKTQLEVKDGKYTYAHNADNYVRVDQGGWLLAGDKSVIDISITGVKVPEGSISGSYNGYSGQGSYTITALDDEGNHYDDIETGIHTGTMDYANYLNAQWQRVCDLIEAYSRAGHESDPAYAGYLQERAMLEDQMEQLGLMRTFTENGRTQRIPVTSGYQIVYVELPDQLTASGGNIVVTADSLYGSGSLTAHGQPRISVINTSNAYLKVNSMTIGDSGGGILFRENKLADGDEGRAQINALNKKSAYQASFSKLVTGASGSGAGISIQNENRWDEEIPVVDSQAGQGLYRALGNVEIAGSLQGALTPVRIENRSGSIVIDSGTKDKPVNVNGAQIVMNARGDISQGYTDSLVNIGYTPQSALAGLELAKKQTTTTYTTNSQNELSETRTATQSEVDAALDGKTGNGRISGGSIYLAASAININGTIQSGYGDYSVSVDEDALQNAISASRSGINGKIVNGRMMYKVTEGGAVANADGSFRYGVEVYYDPLSERLVTEAIETTGGKIHLTGRVISTGGGKIFAADGGAEISITNTSDAALDVNRITNNSISGVIQITDTLTNQRVTYTRDGDGRTVATQISDYSAWVNAAEADKAQYVHDLGETNSFTPKAKVRYNWTDGTETSTRTTYKTDKTAFLSLITTDEQRLSSEESNSATIKESVTLNGKPLPIGAYVQTDSTSEDPYLLTASNQQSSETRSAIRSWTEWRFLNKHYYSQWTKTSGTRQVYVNSLLADKAVDIGFLGSKDGSITLSSSGDINLTANIRNNSAGADLTISSSAGSITQDSGAMVYGNRASLSAQDAIRSFDMAALDSASPVQLEAVTRTGDIGISVNGNVNLTTVAAGAASLSETAYGTQNVALRATGAISQQASGFGVKGQRIDITAGGAVGSISGEALKVQAGQTAEGNDTLSASISVDAAGEVSLIQTAGNMRIGRIDSHGSDVRIQAQGTLVDATPYSTSSSTVDTDELVDKWVSAGLIEGPAGNPYLQRLAQEADDYEQGVRSGYESYLKLKAYFQANPQAPEYRTDENYTEQQEAENRAAYDQLVDRYSRNKAAFADLENKYGPYASADAYLAQDERYAVLTDRRDHPKYEWTRDQMLYAIRSAIVNKQTGSTDQEKKSANIVGRNVTIEALGIGLDRDTKQEITAEMLQGPDAVQYLKVLANADAADVTIEYERDAQGGIVYSTIPVYRTTDLLDGNGQRVIDHYEDPERRIGPVYRKTVALDALGNPVVDHYEQGQAVIDKFIVGGKTPVGIYATGTLNAQSTGSGASEEGAIYIASRKQDDANPAPVMQIGQIQTSGQQSDVRLLGKAGVVSALSESGLPNVSARDLLVEGGSGSIGEITDAGQIRNFNVDLTGSLEMRADGDIYVRSLRTSDQLLIASAYSPGSITIQSDFGIGMADVYEGLGYISAGTGLNMIVDPASGVIGSNDIPVRILDSGNAIELTALSAYIKGVNGEGASDKMLLGAIQVGDTLSVLNLEHPIELLADYEKTVIKVDEHGDPVLDGNGRYTTETVQRSGSITTVGDSATVIIEARRHITLNGSVTSNGSQSDNASLLLSSDGDSILINGRTSMPNVSVLANQHVTEGASGVISAKTMSLTAGGYVSLENAANDISQIGIHGVDSDSSAGQKQTLGDIAIIVGNEQLEFTADDPVLGNVSVSNRGVASSGNTRTGGHIVWQGGLQAHNDENRPGQQGSISLTAQGDVQVTGTTQADNGILISSEAGKINVNGKMSADTGAISMTAYNGSIQTQGDIDAGSTISAIAGGDITFDGELDAGGSVTTMVTGDHNIFIKGNVTSGVAHPGDDQSQVVSVVTGSGGIYYEGSITARGDISGLVEGGEAVSGIYVNGSAVSQNGSVRAELSQTVESGQNAHQGFIAVNGNISAARDVDMRMAKDGAFVAEGSIRSSGNVGISIGQNGDVDVLEEIDASGDISVRIGSGDISIGSGTSAGSVAVHAAGSIALSSGLGRVEVYGAARTDSGDISIAAASPAYAQGLQNSSIVIGVGSQINSGRNVTLEATRGDIYVTDAISSSRSLTTITHEQGDVYFETDVAVNGNVLIRADQGDVVIGEEVTSAAGDIDIQTTQGDVNIGKAMKAENGSVTVKVGEAGPAGGIIVGNLGQDVRTVSAGTDVTLEVTEGRVFVYGQTEAGRDVSISAGASQYGTSTYESIVIEQNGAIKAARDASLTVTNGDLYVSDDVLAGRNLNVQALSEGTVFFDETISGSASVKAYAEKGDIAVSASVTSESGDIAMSVGEGNVWVNQAVTAENGSIGIQVGTDESGGGGITLGLNNETGMAPGADYALKAGQDISLKTPNGKITVYGKAYAGAAEQPSEGNLTVLAGSGTYDASSSILFGQHGELRSYNDTNIVVVNSDLLVDSHFAVGNNLYASVFGEGKVTFQSLRSAGDVAQGTDIGSISGEILEAGGMVDLSVTEQGDIRFMQISAPRVWLSTPDSVEVNRINVGSNGSESIAVPDLLLSGRIIRVDRIGKLESGQGAGQNRITIALEGEGRDRSPIESVVIGNLAAGAVVQNMWAKNGDITVSSGDLHVSKIYSEDKVTFRNGSLDIAVYGTTPRRDGERIVLWNNMFENSPAGDRAAWHSGSGSDKRWLTLDLNSGGGARVRNGIIVDYGDYVQLDRTSDSVVNQMRARLTDNPYRAATFEAISLFDRTPLSVPAPVLNPGPARAEEEKISVE